MAGSNKYFLYTTDLGDVFAARLDESNTEAVNGTEGDFPNNGAVRYELPRNVVPRRLVYQSGDGNRVIKCVALDQGTYNSAVDDTRTIPDPLISGNTLTLVRLEPERIRLPRGEDTGLNDGDAT